ncbi:MAG: outer membrane protein assembly factor BamB family protein [Pirellulales bacterium]
MTDEELIRLVQEKPPEELSLDEIELLRRRLAESPELRKVLLDQLQLEQYLGSALGRVHVSVDEILRGTRGARSTGRAVLAWATAVAVVLLASAGLVLAVVGFRPESRADREPTTNGKPEQVAAAKSTADTSANGAKKPASATTPSHPSGTNAAGVNTSAPGASAKGVSASSQAKTESSGTKPSAPAPAPPAEAAPWDAADQLGRAPRPIEEVLLEDYALGKAVPSQAQLKEWLTLVEGGFGSETREERSLAVLDGVARLRAPWRPDALLRLSFYGLNSNLKLHFWNGNEGVTFYYYHEPNRAWAAYRTTREGNGPKPATYVLLTTDDQRYHRALANGSFELRHQNGMLMLGRGDMPILTVPFDGPPREFDIEGRALVRHIDMIRATGSIPEPAQNPVVFQSERPADLPWKSETPGGAELKKLPDGRIELASATPTAPAWAATPIGKPGLYEFIFLVEDASAGTGVFLGDEKTPVRYRLGFFREGQGVTTSFDFLKTDEKRTTATHDVRRAPAPLAGQRQWLRIVFGCTMLKCWTSPDGVHWGGVVEPLRWVFGPFTHVGVFCLDGKSPRSIKLQRIEVRELKTLTDLAPRDLIAKAIVPPAVASPMAVWLETVLEKQPPGAEPGAWRRACAIRTLAEGPSPDLNWPLLEGLLADGLAEPTPLAVKLRLLDEAALLADTLSWPQDIIYFRRYVKLARTLARDGQPRPYSATAAATLSTPVVSFNPTLPTMPEEAVQSELLSAVFEGRWDDVHSVCRRLRFFSQPTRPAPQWPDNREDLRRMVEWAEGRAAANMPNRAGESPAPTHVPWRHPFIEELNKEGYNVMAEFQAALAGGSFEDACQVICSAGPSSALGLLPDAKDPRLLVSLHDAVATAMHDHPPLQQAMLDKFAPVGRLRVRQAVADGDPLAVEAATIQFYGTEAAADASLWLGDRALSGGDFARAIARYQQAQAHVSASQRVALAARLRLAAAMAGRDPGKPIAEAVQFGDTRLSAAEFEAMIAEVRRNHPGAEPISLPGPSTAGGVAIPAPSGFETRTSARLDGDAGQGASDVPWYWQPRRLDWAGSQIATAVTPSLLLVSNRFQVAAYELDTGQRKWQTSLGAEQGRSHAWPFIAMQPVVAGNRFFVRRLLEKGPELACLHVDAGKVLWRQRPGDYVASEPLLVEDGLFALTVTTDRNQTLQLYLTRFDLDTGRWSLQQPLAHFNDPGQHQLSCAASMAGDLIVAHLGGTVLACDLSGQIRWLRRQEWMPPVGEGEWPDQRSATPLVDGERVVVSQLMAGNIECLQRATGRLVWRRVLPGLKRLAGPVQGRLVAETPGGLVGLDPATGRPVWFRDVDDLLEAQLCGENGVLYAFREPVRENRERMHVTLVWLDAKTGNKTGQFPLTGLADQVPMFGPVAVSEKRLWGVFGRGVSDVNRDVVELVPKGDAFPGSSAPNRLDRWATHVEVEMRDAAAAALPKWTLLDGAKDKETGLYAEMAGQSAVFATVADKTRPTRLARQLVLPAGAAAKLVMRVGHDPNQKWKLLVKINGATKLEQPINATTTLNGWKDLQVDLAPYAGQTVCLLVTQLEDGVVPSRALWKKLDVVGK